MKKFFLFAAAALSAIIVEAQQLRDGHFFKSFTDAEVTAQAAPEVFSEWFTLPEGTEWRETRRATDNLGMEHVDYRQYVGGIEVEHAIVKLHFKDGVLRSANGNVMEARRSPVKLRRAPLVYKNGTPVDELGRKLLLVYTNEGYRYATKMLSADRNYWIYTDAESGKELQRISTRYYAEPQKATVTGSTIYSGEVQMDASYNSEEGVYYLYDQERNIHTMIGALLPSFEQMIADKTLYLNFPELEACNIPIEELTMEKLDQWLGDNFIPKDFHPWNYIGRNGIYASSSTTMFDSYRFKSFTLDRLSVSTGSGMEDLQPSESLPLQLRVCISYKNSEGMIECQQEDVTKLPYTIDMTMTNDEIPVVGATISIYERYLGEDGQKEVKLLASLEIKPDESGVQNKWFYLLSDGGTGINDNNFTYDVTGIGIDKAQQIVYRVLTQYATSQAQYADIRLNSLQSASDLYGAESAELASVSDAWNAVGVADGSTTGIEMVKNSQPALNGQTGKWYTLDGCQLEGQPTKKGLYIYNGNKVAIK